MSIKEALSWIYQDHIKSPKIVEQLEECRDLWEDIFYDPDYPESLFLYCTTENIKEFLVSLYPMLLETKGCEVRQVPLCFHQGNGLVEIFMWWN